MGAAGVIHDVQITMKESIYGYHGSVRSPFLKVFFRKSNMMSKGKRALEDGISIPGLGQRAAQTYESNLQYLLRFMIDCKVRLIAKRICLVVWSAQS